MKKIFVLPAREDWIVDRFVSEWNEDNFDISTKDPTEANVIWLMASWCWSHMPLHLLSSKKVVATIHHIVPEKFDDNRRRDFELRDKFVDAYHVYNCETQKLIQSLTNKPVQLIEYWANQKIWKKTSNKSYLREKYSLSKDSYVIGSFQRDSEGSNQDVPKLEKGPDLFVEYVVKAWNDWKNGNLERKPHVLLAGWRRQYVINRLELEKVPYTYLERPPQQILNELYQTLDLYPVTSRCEGGPQSLIECGLLDIKVVSRNVGIAKQVLPNSAINDDAYMATPTVPNVERWKLPYGYSKYRNFLLEL